MGCGGVARSVGKMVGESAAGGGGKGGGVMCSRCACFGQRVFTAAPFTSHLAFPLPSSWR